MQEDDSSTGRDRCDVLQLHVMENTVALDGAHAMWEGRLHGSVLMYCVIQSEVFSVSLAVGKARKPAVCVGATWLGRPDHFKCSVLTLECPIQSQ
jgi:hypothetical protein